MISVSQWQEVHDASLAIHRSECVDGAIRETGAALRSLVRAEQIEHRIIDDSTTSAKPLRPFQAKLSNDDGETECRCSLHYPGGRTLVISVRTEVALDQSGRRILELLGEHLACAIHQLTVHLSPEPCCCSLTSREEEIFPLVAAGRTNEEIAARLHISERTVEKHVASILQKCGIENRKLLIASYRGGAEAVRENG